MDNDRTIKDDLYDLNAILKKLYYWPVILPICIALITNFKYNKKLGKNQHSISQSIVEENSIHTDSLDN